MICKKAVLEFQFIIAFIIIKRATLKLTWFTKFFLVSISASEGPLPLELPSFDLNNIPTFAEINKA